MYNIFSFGLKKVLSRSHTRSEGHSTALQSTESTLLPESSLVKNIIVANLFVMQTVERG